MEDGSVILFETEGPKELKTFKAHEAAVYDVAFSPDGATLATTSTDKLAKLWDWKAEMPMEKAKLEGHGDAVWAVAWSKDGSLATAGADRKIKLWSADGKQQQVLQHHDVVNRALWSPDGTRVVFRSARTGRFDLYEKRTTGEAVEERIVASDQFKLPSSWSPDGRFILFQSADPRTSADRNLRTSGKALLRMEINSVRAEEAASLRRPVGSSPLPFALRCVGPSPLPFVLRRCVGPARRANGK